MCDCPTTKIFATHTRVRKGWIIFAECKTENVTTEDIQTETKINDADIEMFLDPSLRPVTPDLNDPQSTQIYEEHKQLAEEYLQVQKDIQIFYETRKKLVESQTEEEKEERQEYQKLLSDKEGLTLYFENLKSQIQRLQNNSPPDDGWVLLSNNENPSQ